MSFRGASVWKAAVFDNERDAHKFNSHHRNAAFPTPAFVRTDHGWILFGPQDVRDGMNSYHFALQYTKCDKTVRVRVGCRMYTLGQAFNHWGKKTSTYSSRGNSNKQALAIINLMVLQAQAYGLLTRFTRPITMKTTLIKRKRK